MGSCVSRTIADLEGPTSSTSPPHIAKALQYRRREGDQAEGPEKRSKVELRVSEKP